MIRARSYLLICHKQIFNILSFYSLQSTITNWLLPLTGSFEHCKQHTQLLITSSSFIYNFIVNELFIKQIVILKNLSFLGIPKTWSNCISIFSKFKVSRKTISTRSCEMSSMSTNPWISLELSIWKNTQTSWVLQRS